MNINEAPKRIQGCLSLQMYFPDLVPRLWHCFAALFILPSRNNNNVGPVVWLWTPVAKGLLHWQWVTFWRRILEVAPSFCYVKIVQHCYIIYLATSLKTYWIPCIEQDLRGTANVSSGAAMIDVILPRGISHSAPGIVLPNKHLQRGISLVSCAIHLKRAST